MKKFIPNLSLFICFFCLADGGEVKPPNEDNILLSQKVDRPGYLLAMKIDFDIKNGLYLPAKYYCSFHTKDDSNSFNFLIKNTQGLSETDPKRKTLSIEAEGGNPIKVKLAYEFTENSNINWKKIQDRVNNKQIQYDNKNVSIDCYEVCSDKYTKTMLVIFKADSLGDLKKSYILNNGEIFLWNFVEL